MKKFGSHFAVALFIVAEPRKLRVRSIRIGKHIWKELTCKTKK